MSVQLHQGGKLLQKALRANIRSYDKEAMVNHKQRIRRKSRHRFHKPQAPNLSKQPSGPAFQEAAKPEPGRQPAEANKVPAAGQDAPAPV